MSVLLFLPLFARDFPSELLGKGQSFKVTALFDFSMKNPQGHTVQGIYVRLDGSKDPYVRIGYLVREMCMPDAFELEETDDSDFHVFYFHQTPTQKLPGQISAKRPRS